MSNAKPSYRLLNIKKGSYESNAHTTIIKTHKVQGGKNKGKTAYITITIGKNGEKSYVIKYSDSN